MVGSPSQIPVYGVSPGVPLWTHAAWPKVPQLKLKLASHQNARAISSFMNLLNVPANIPSEKLTAVLHWCIYVKTAGARTDSFPMFKIGQCMWGPW